MKFKKESLNLLYFVWSNIKNKRKKQLLFILPIIFIGSLSESFTIAAVVPFLLNIINKNSINIQNRSFSFISEILPENTNNLFLLLVLIIIFSLTFRMLSIYSYNKWTALVGSDLSYKTFSHFTNIKYSSFKQTKETDITNILHTSINNTSAYIYNLITIFVCLITSFGFIFTGLFLNTKLFIIIFLSLSMIYGYVLFYTKNKLNSIGIVQHKYIQNAYQYIHYAYGSFKDIKLENSSKEINKIYLENDLVRRISASHKKLISSFPKIIIEAAAILLVTSIIIFLHNTKNYNPEFGLDILIISLIFSRLLPVFQLLFSSWTSLKVCSFSVLQLKNFLDERNQSNNYDKDNTGKNKFFDNFEFLEIRNLTQEYNKKNIFENINFKIIKGEWLGIYGNSGAGKSTLLDCMMGLSKPSKGRVIVNRKEIYESKFNSYWREAISHCAPEPFLIESDIISNIKTIFSSEELNLNRLKKAWYCSALDEFISLDYALRIYKKDDFNSYHKFLKSFSSGQKQRIAIARTLYKDKEVLMLDEFTSALDSNTEKLILNRLKTNYPDKTFIIISHRKYPLEFCDKLIKL